MKTDLHDLAAHTYFYRCATLAISAKCEGDKAHRILTCKGLSCACLHDYFCFCVCSQGKKEIIKISGGLVTLLRSQTSTCLNGLEPYWSCQKLMFEKKKKDATGIKPNCVFAPCRTTRCAQGCDQTLISGQGRHKNRQIHVSHIFCSISFLVEGRR